MQIMWFFGRTPEQREAVESMRRSDTERYEIWDAESTEPDDVEESAPGQIG